ncbi:MAG: hypothetical protein HYV41_01570 [Candidatus Magasanikbacteria bacterium]|nr:hypothetical protein [Candidatus Magasanikbacteria bacterium]
MNFQESYNWLLSLSNMPRKEYMNDPRKCEWYLLRLQFFLNMLGNPEKKIPHYIHVTGTSGKGSTVAFLHNILHASGKKVGSTYSPHPSTILERWKIGNRYMSKKEFVDIIKIIKPKLDLYSAKTPYDMLSFFELTEVIGFVFFVRKKITHAVLEVACGGRYDASNIIPRKDIAIITNIGRDHIGIIGNNIQEIAYEKAGIIKKGSVVFTQEKNKAILDIIKNESEKTNAFFKPIKFEYKILQHTIEQTIFEYKKNLYTLYQPGEHQIKNAILCIEVSQQLGIEIPKIKKGLAKTSQPLRMEIVSHKPLLILDGAHNEDKIKSSVAALQLIQKPNQQIHLVVGFSADKQITKLVKLLATLKPASIAVTRNTVNPFRKVADPQDIRNKFKKLLPHTKFHIFLDPLDALKWSKKQAEKNDIILSTGSIFVSGEIRSKIK